jgi:hypothetical protein
MSDHPLDRGHASDHRVACSVLGRACAVGARTLAEVQLWRCPLCNPMCTAGHNPQQRLPNHKRQNWQGAFQSVKCV